ncbi:jg3351 [Pararge aegeria aegeria]|uniref:Jg3351 protein n=1 Tax=Pararge aegeria aegeria TaxID=348720 RepID=A0A8S4RTU7_9NEOP|nr:jg3351 [Pararge aegeria aegeria]
MQGPKSQLPRSNSTPAQQNDPVQPSSPNKGYVLRSFSSPESKQSGSRRDSDSLYHSNSHDSRSELDSDLETFEHFEECLLDIDADNEDIYGLYQRSPDSDEPKKVVTTLLPGSGLQRISMRPITSNILKPQGTREAQKKFKRENAENKRFSRLNFRPLIVKMPTQNNLLPMSDSDCLGIEELQTSPPLELESLELDRELDDAEELLKRGAAIAVEESDSDMSSTSQKHAMNTSYNKQPEPSNAARSRK